MLRVRVIAVCVVSVVVSALAPAPAAQAAPDVLTFSSPPQFMTGGPDGNVWAIEQDGLIAKIASNRAVTEYTAPAQSSLVSGRRAIVAGPGGYIWFTNSDAGIIERMTTSGGLKPFTVPNAIHPLLVTPGPSGDLWYIGVTVTPAAYWFGSVTPTGTFSPVVQIQADAPPGVYDMSLGPDGAMWYLSNFVGRALLDGTNATFPAPHPTSPPDALNMVSGADGNLWYALGPGLTTDIVRFAPTGEFTSFSYDASFPTSPTELVLGSDAAVWFADGEHLGRVAPDGSGIVFDASSLGFTEVLHPTFSNDGTLWFIADGTAHPVRIGDLVDFVTNVYLDVLGRPVDNGGLTYWVGQFLVTGGFTDRGELTQMLVASKEWRDHTVADLFVALLRRPAEPAGLAYWSAQLAAGARIEDLKSLIIGSDEYFDVEGHGLIDDYVTSVYQDLLGRDPEPAGLAYWRDRLMQPGPRSAVATALVYSNEAFRVLVRGIYEHYLDRAPDQAGETFWANQLGSGMTDQALVVFITASDEYFDKP